jgi:uncharacterized membrane protein
VTVEANHLAPRRSRLLYSGFVLSLALNLLFVGGIAAAIWHQHNSAQSKRDDSGLLGFAKDLSPDRQDGFRQLVLAERASLKSERDKVRSAWIEANNLLTVEPFDKEKFKAAMAKLRVVEDQYKTGLNNAFAEMVATLTPEERKLLQSWREKRKPRLLGRNHDKTGDNGK